MYQLGSDHGSELPYASDSLVVIVISKLECRFRMWRRVNVLEISEL